MAIPKSILEMLRAAAGAYGANYDVLKYMTQYESGGRDEVNNWDSNAAKGTPSAGILQFIKPTFDAYARQAKQANPNAWRGVNMSWRDPRAQALATAWAITHGKGSAWATYDRALSSAGASSPKGPRSATVMPAGAGGGEASSMGLTSPTMPTNLWSRYFGEDDPEFAAIMDRRAARRAAQFSQTIPLRSSSSPSTPATKAGSYNGALHNYKDIMAWASKLAGAKIQGSFQTTGGDHAKGSLHYSGKAVDYGDANTSRKQFMILAAYAKAHPELFREFFYNPLGWGIKNGQIIKGLSVSGHDNHMHIGAY